MTLASDILVAGGYGVVGRRISARLARSFPGRVVVAGRSQERAAALCRELGQGARPQRLDVNDPGSIGAALGGVGTVMTCVAQRERHLLGAAVERGLAYTDIAPDLAFWQRAEELASDARRTGARVVLGAGLSPGISNVMARQLADRLGAIDRIETAILLSLGDEYGPDSLGYVLDAALRPWTVVENGRPREARAFTEKRTLELPSGPQTAYLFPWSDVAFYPKTLGARTALGWLALEPAWVGRVAAALLRSRARSWLERPAAMRRVHGAVERLRHASGEQDRFALVVSAESGERALRASLAGRHEADATAAAACELASSLATGAIRDPGVWLPEQVVEPERFFDALFELGWKVELEEERSLAASRPVRREELRP